MSLKIKPSTLSFNSLIDSQYKVNNLHTKLELYYGIPNYMKQAVRSRKLFKSGELAAYRSPSDRLDII